MTNENLGGIFKEISEEMNMNFSTDVVFFTEKRKS